MKKTKKPPAHNKKSTIPRVILNMMVSADGKLTRPEDFPIAFNQKPLQHYQKQIRSTAISLPALDSSNLSNPGSLARFLRQQQAGSSDSILCENDASSAGVLFRSGLVTELHLIICPFIVGGRHRLGMAEIEGEMTLAQATVLRFKSWRNVGEARVIIYSADCAVRGSSGAG